MIAAYSPKARGRSERSFGTWQGRLPQELRLAEVTTVEGANQFLRDHYTARFNEQFLFVEGNWVPVMLGQNIIPKHVDPMAECMEWTETRRILQDVRSVCRERVMAMPAQKDFIARHCAAPVT